MHNAVDLLQRATLRLSQEGSIKDRLADAYASHLIGIDAEDLPQHLRADFDALCAAMNREIPLPRESAINASVRKMSGEEARYYAALVVRVFAAVAREGAQSAGVRRSTARMLPGTPVVQLLASDG